MKMTKKEIEKELDRTYAKLFAVLGTPAEAKVTDRLEWLKDELYKAEE
jgi:hypothetical protein